MLAVRDLDNTTLIRRLLDEEINPVRLAFRDTPIAQMPSGKCDDPEDCPLKWAFECRALSVRVHKSLLEMAAHSDGRKLGRTLETIWGSEKLLTLDEKSSKIGPWVAMTPMMFEFVRRFDAGHIPELIAPAPDPIHVFDAVTASSATDQLGGGSGTDTPGPPPEDAFGGGATGGAPSRERELQPV